MSSCWVPPRSGQPPARARRAYGRHGRAGGGHGASLSGRHLTPPPPYSRPVPDPTSPQAYPRPQLHARSGRTSAAHWEFAHDDAGRRSRPRAGRAATARSTATIEVPYPPESRASGIGDTGCPPGGLVPPRRSHGAGRPGPAAAAALRRGRLPGRVWVNGELVATHEGGHTPFPPTSPTRSTATATQVVVVRAEDRPARLGPAPRQAGLAARAARHLVPPHDRHLAAGLAGAGARRPHRRPRTGRPTSARCGCRVDGRARADAGAERHPARRSACARADRVARRATSSASAPRTAVCVSTLPALRHGQDRGDLLWTPEQPEPDRRPGRRSLAPDGTVIDAVDSYVGLRGRAASRTAGSCSTVGPTTCGSVLEQGYWPQSHLAAPTPTRCAREVELIKALGFNAVRIHQKVEDPRFLYWCDRLGLLVWGEMASAYAFSPTRGASASPASGWRWSAATAATRASSTWVPDQRELGRRRRSRTTRPQRDSSTALYHLTKALDPTRPVIANDGWEHTRQRHPGRPRLRPTGELLRERYGSREAVDRAARRPAPAAAAGCCSRASATAASR